VISGLERGSLSATGRGTRMGHSCVRLSSSTVPCSVCTFISVSEIVYSPFFAAKITVPEQVLGARYSILDVSRQVA